MVKKKLQKKKKLNSTDLSVATDVKPVLLFS
jgi:hypothetical protein